MPALPGVAGTTGYEWLNVISRVLVDGRRAGEPRRCRGEATDPARRFAADPGERKAARAGQPCWRASSPSWRGCSRRIAAGHYSTRDIHRPRCATRAAALHPRVSGLSHLRHRTGPSAERSRRHRAHDRRRARALARRRSRDLRFPARRAHARSHSPERPATAARACAVRLQAAAIHRPDDGEVAGGHRLLSLPRVARP